MSYYYPATDLSIFLEKSDSYISHMFNIMGKPIEHKKINGYYTLIKLPFDFIECVKKDMIPLVVNPNKEFDYKERYSRYKYVDFYSIPIFFYSESDETIIEQRETEIINFLCSEAIKETFITNFRENKTFVKFKEKYYKNESLKSAVKGFTYYANKLVEMELLEKVQKVNISTTEIPFYIESKSLWKSKKMNLP